MEQGRKRCNLVIDVGNTFTKIAVVCGETIVFNERYKEQTHELIVEIINKYTAERGIISAVGELPPNFETFFPQDFSLLHFTSKVKVPLKTSYKTPETLGADRLALAVAASSLFPESNVLVVDFGSAITYDFVSKGGDYEGGAISPGVEMRFKALNYFTARLPLVSKGNDFPVIGQTTTESIRSGVLNGVLSEVKGFIKEVSQRHEDLKVVFSGGDANFFEKKLNNTIFVNPNLLIFGLNRILNHNVSS